MGIKTHWIKKWRYERKKQYFDTNFHPRNHRTIWYPIYLREHSRITLMAHAITIAKEKVQFHWLSFLKFCAEKYLDIFLDINPLVSNLHEAIILFLRYGFISSTNDCCRAEMLEADNSFHCRSCNKKVNVREFQMMHWFSPGSEGNKFSPASVHFPYQFEAFWIRLRDISEDQI